MQVTRGEQNSYSVVVLHQNEALGVFQLSKPLLYGSNKALEIA